MKEIAVVSGKGGTGKTSFVAAFANLAQNQIVLGDCDVDASNLGILCPGTDIDEEPFYAGLRVSIDKEKCFMCGNCVEVCRYDALSLGDDLVPQVSSLDCEGCRACSVVCPVDALTFGEKRSGTIQIRETASGPLIHASLGMAEDNSGKLVSRVREKARLLAESRQIDTILLDGPPGIGCPVHATLSGIDLVVAVTEPTPSGLHDLDRLIELCSHFKLQVLVVVNKYDLNRELTDALETKTGKNGAHFIGRVPFHPDVPMALARNATPLEVPVVRDAVHKIWDRVQSF